MLQKQETTKQTTHQIKLPAQGAKIKLTPEELENVMKAADKSCLCHDAATFSWENPCTPSA